MNHESEFRVYRAKEGDPQGPKSAMADLHRRAEVSQQANERYLEALATRDDTTRLKEVIRPLERRREWKGK